MGTMVTRLVKYIRLGEKGEPGEPGKPGQKGDRGCTLRGPQSWDDLYEGYAFQDGKETQYLDVVEYYGQYYICIKTHTKTATNYPNSIEDMNFHYWEIGDRMELVATKVLLANYAIIKNLGVEAVEMKDRSGNVLFLCKDGQVTCNVGNFKNVNVEGQIRAKTLQLQKSTKPVSTDYVDVDGSIIIGVGRHYLPELEEGVIQEIKWLANEPRPNGANVFSGRNSNVTIQTMPNTQPQPQIQIPAIRTGLFVFIGIGLTGKTVWHLTQCEYANQK